jgi:diguanylate cyclase
MKAGTMNEADELRQAKAFSEKAFAAMTAHGVPPTPENFTVWYAYAVGLVPDLKRAIDLMIANQDAFSQTVNSDLYNRFCNIGEHFNLLQETGDGLYHAADQLIHYVKTASGDTQAFGKTLDRYSTELGAAPGGDKLRTMVSGLILETQRVAERNRILEAQLNESSSEIQQLRQNLELVRRESLTRGCAPPCSMPTKPASRSRWSSPTSIISSISTTPTAIRWAIRCCASSGGH